MTLGYAHISWRTRLTGQVPTSFVYVCVDVAHMQSLVLGGGTNGKGVRSKRRVQRGVSFLAIKVVARSVFH